MSILGAIGGIAGSLLGGLFGNKQAEEQAELQREFAQNGIRWKVEDAKAAGIHPLYALGAQTTAYSPVSVGAPDFATGGQNLGSAIDAMRTPAEKADGYEKTVKDLTLQKMGLENEVLASQIRMLNQPGRGPGMPGDRMISGQGNTPAVSVMSTAGGDFSIAVDQKNSPAQDAENQYGEVAGEIYGIGNLLSDLNKQKSQGRVGSRPLGKAIDLLTDYYLKAGPDREKQPNYPY